jgi:hypothetical protein
LAGGPDASLEFDNQDFRNQERPSRPDSDKLEEPLQAGKNEVAFNDCRQASNMTIIDMLS